MSIAFKGASVLVITAALILGCATIGTEISDEEFATLYAGAWSNPEYQPLTYSAPNGIRRIVTQRDGTFESYRQIGVRYPSTRESLSSPPVAGRRREHLVPKHLRVCRELHPLRAGSYQSNGGSV